MIDKQKWAEGPREPEPMAKNTEEQELQNRREFLISLGKWSAAIVGIVVGGAIVPEKSAQAAAWLNGRGGYGGGWVNRRGGGHGSWANRRGGGYGGSWVNRR